jgi:hypothetical protein
MSRRRPALLLARLALSHGVVKLLIDTDMSVDVDDVGMLCAAHSLVERGEAEILAVVHDTGLPAGVGAISAINTWWGRSGIKIGGYHGDVGDPDQSGEPAWFAAANTRRSLHCTYAHSANGPGRSHPP